MKQKSSVQTAEAEEAEQEVAEVHSVTTRWSCRSHCGPAVSAVSRWDASGQEKKQEAERGAAAPREEGRGGEAVRPHRTDWSRFWASEIQKVIKLI